MAIALPASRGQYLVNVENSLRLFLIGVEDGKTDPGCVATFQQFQQPFPGWAEYLPFGAEFGRFPERRGRISGQEQSEGPLAILELPEGAFHLFAPW